MGIFTTSSHRDITPAAARVAPRVIRNQRWIPADQLEVGMYVMELDRPWLETKFLFQGFLIDSEKLLREVQASCDTALVQSEKVPSRAAPLDGIC